MAEVQAGEHPLGVYATTGGLALLVKQIVAEPPPLLLEIMRIG